MSPAWARGKRTACLGNLRQLGAATMMYAEDDKDRSLSAKTNRNGDHDLNWLNNGYVNSPQLFICPATGNFIRTNRSQSEFTDAEGLTDLMNLAVNRRNNPGMSYRGLGFAGLGVPTYTDLKVNSRTVRIVEIRKTLNNIQTYEKYHDAFGLKGTVAGPVRMVILGDNIQSGESDYLDSNDSHGTGGANAAFCDGHVDWIPESKFIFTYELSQDENRTEPPGKE